jgi:hypothetical protein
LDSKASGQETEASKPVVVIEAGMQKKVEWTSAQLDSVIAVDSLKAAEIIAEKEREISSENARKIILARQEKEKKELIKTSLFMFEISAEFPSEYQVPNPRNKLDGSPSSGDFFLTLFYAKPGNQTWQEIGLVSYVNIKGNTDSEYHFYGKKGWKYAYSWNRGLDKPIKLVAVNVKNKWKVE